jgi:hypothetical protein
LPHLHLCQAKRMLWNNNEVERSEGWDGDRNCHHRNFQPGRTRLQLRRGFGAQGHLILTLVHGCGITHFHDGTGGIVQDVFQALDIGIGIWLIFERDRCIKDRFFPSLD